MAEEALKCFESLYEAVPGMIEELDGVLKTSKENQKQMLAENQQPEQSEGRPKRPSISSSLKSISKEEKATEPKPQEVEPTAIPGQHQNMTQADALRLAQRKRKTASVCSGRQSGPHKYRSRSLVVVYYDGDVQKRFEGIVRSIGVCRNSMRKGKMNAKLDKMARTGSSSSEDSPGEGLRCIRRANAYSTTMWPTSALPKNDGNPAFDKADGFLDKAQTLCERAAHQVLRDGDCALEVNNAKENLVNAHKLTEAELPTLRKRAEKAAEKRRLSEERRRNEVDDEEKTDDTSIDKLEIDERVNSPTQELEVDELEVDESDEELVHDTTRPLVDTLQLSKFQVRNARRLTDRLAAAA